MADNNIVIPGSIGYFLIKGNIITEEQLAEALEIQAQEKETPVLPKTQQEIQLKIQQRIPEEEENLLPDKLLIRQDKEPNRKE